MQDVYRKVYKHGTDPGWVLSVSRYTGMCHGFGVHFVIEMGCCIIIFSGILMTCFLFDGV